MANTTEFPACWIDFNSIAVASLRPLLRDKCLFDHEPSAVLPSSLAGVVFSHHPLCILMTSLLYQRVRKVAKGVPLSGGLLGSIDYEGATAVFLISLRGNGYCVIGLWSLRGTLRVLPRACQCWNCYGLSAQQTYLAIGSLYLLSAESR